MYQISLNKYDEVYLRRLPRRFNGPEGKIELLKILNQSLQHPINEVALINGMDVKTIYWWLKQIFGEDYQNALKQPKIPLIARQPSKRLKLEDTTEYFARIRKEMVEVQEKCVHPSWVMRCTPCGKILASDATVTANMTIGEITKCSDCKFIIEQTI